MNIIELIKKKRDGGKLSYKEIKFLIDSYVNNEIKDYQMSALLMAIFIRGMQKDEISSLTKSMLYSGNVINLEHLNKVFVDKHSTGGVGDKVSLILAPLVAACGAYVPMVSGRSLGHTGGTLDKLESIPMYKTAIPPALFVKILAKCGYVMASQNESLVPADRLIYALRDVTGTVESLPLIVSSILSKKIAEGTNAIVFDIKCGSGAFMKNIDQARSLANMLIEICAQLKKHSTAIITRMDEPLGIMVGNFLEIEECAWCLNGYKSEVFDDTRSADLMEVTFELGAHMLMLSGNASNYDQAKERLILARESGRAWEKFIQNVELQGGDVQSMKRKFGNSRAKIRDDIVASCKGIINTVDAYKIGLAGVELGVGRKTQADTVLPDVGIELLVKSGSKIEQGQKIATIYARHEKDLQKAKSLLNEAYIITDKYPPKNSMILEIIT